MLDGRTRLAVLEGQRRRTGDGSLSEPMSSLRSRRARGHRDGRRARKTLEQGDVALIPPGYDAWVNGDERVVLFEETLETEP
ncbi:hypothetical protein C491_16692 [Natronococcus amylolyticus DSM 10524]|uniref:Cupin n=2 Tax=Natronococcus amylolyticus TaxID=44470 RepID=L9X180_9EURY|nr:hypothetical protein C491_16692 [Natronococcus amylolyticus DSM 10524]